MPSDCRIALGEHKKMQVAGPSSRPAESALCIVTGRMMILELSKDESRSRDIDTASEIDQEPVGSWFQFSKCTGGILTGGYIRPAHRFQ